MQPAFATRFTRALPTPDPPTPATPSPEVTPDIDLIIPVLNEEARIGRTIAAVREWAHGIDRSVRVTVVDNGSADATSECVDRAFAHHPSAHPSAYPLSVRVLGCRVRGKGAAVRSGVLRSSASVVGYCDADLSTPMSAMTDALELLDEGWEVVLGSRHCAGAAFAVPPSLLRRWGGWCFRRAARPYVGTVADTQCGFKLLNGDAARAVFDRLELTSFAFDVELVARVLQAGYRVVELPVRWTDERGSTFRPLRDGVSSFRDLAVLRGALAVDA